MGKCLLWNRNSLWEDEQKSFSLALFPSLIDSDKQRAGVDHSLCTRGCLQGFRELCGQWEPVAVGITQPVCGGVAGETGIFVSGAAF